MIKFTISLGISQLDDKISNYKAWLEGSDKALYISKESGRNRTTIYQSEAD